MTPDEKIKTILKENGLVFDYQITFPKYRILPDEVQLALKVLRNNGMVIVFSVVPDKNKGQ